MKEKHPEDYEILTTTKVEFEEHKKKSHRLGFIDNVIHKNEITGELEQIRYMLAFLSNSLAYSNPFRSISNTKKVDFGLNYLYD